MSAVYLDHAAAAPLSPAARAAWLEAAAMTGNPSSSHGPGRAARRIVERAREEVAALAGADPLDVIFTSGGTEADNLAVIGLARARRAVDSRCRRIIVSAVEHPAVLGPARQLASEGFELVELPVDASGRVDLSQAAAVIDADRESVALVSCQWTNNETGAIQPLAELAAWARAGGAPIHCDAVQAFAYEAVRLTPAPGSDGPELDALTLSAHKIGGPVGVGALLARRRWPFQPVLFGGGQENGRRPGTVPAAL
ncbi:MAG: aminotransferase class V-fold PLP-dependent enzyme, partial [Propionibacteriaceae bacterium]|nr:aminotransferase class V-fold PLP-dependent enzyme [Propionibacteriaceae bacterium]